MPKMNQQTKLVFALEHIAHLYDLIEDNEYQEYLTSSLSDLEFEIERQLSNELHKKNPKLGEGIQGHDPKTIIKEEIGTIGRIKDQSP